MRFTALLGLSFSLLVACGGKVERQTGTPVDPGAGAGATASTDQPPPDNSVSNPVPTVDPGSGTTTGGGGMPTSIGAGGAENVDAGVVSVVMVDASPAQCSSHLELPVAPCACPPSPSPLGTGWYCGTCGPSSSTTVGPEGGEVTLMDAAGAKDGVPFSLKIPPGALKQRVTITVTATVLPPKIFNATTDGYRVEPLALMFGAPVAIHVPWGSISSTGPNFAIYTAPDTCTAPAKLADSYFNAGFLQGTTQRLGIFFAGAPIGL